MGLSSTLYGLGLSWKRKQCKNPGRLPAKVISIGNLTLGGTGKTPAVMAVAKKARERGLAPCVLTRGYRGRARNVCFVTKGEEPLLNARLAGDEAFLMAETLKGIPVVKGKNRHEAGLFAWENLMSRNENPEARTVFILDDGFQHWNLYRDVDVLLIDGTNPFGKGKLFPEGILREPLSAMKRAHIIVMTKADRTAGDGIAEIEDIIKHHNPEAPIFRAFHKPSGLISATGENQGLDRLHNKYIYAFAGIANPDHFQSTLTSVGAVPGRVRKFRDHHLYTQKDLDTIKSEASGLDIVTTEKDLVKLKKLDIPQNLWALKVEFSIDDEFYDTLFTILK